MLSSCPKGGILLKRRLHGSGNLVNVTEEEATLMGQRLEKGVMKAALGLGLLLGLAGTGLAAAEPNPLGKWRSDDGKVTVEVTYCNAPAVCAKIVGLAKPLDNQGKPKVDWKNPNPALRTRPLIGLEIISGMQPDGVNKWKGRIYVTKDGKTYKAKATLGANVLVVKGSWGPFSKTENFYRVK
jgi:uncharacterized protein (DUF2147 family)